MFWRCILELLRKKVDSGYKRAESGVLSGALSLTVSTVIVKILGLIYKIPITRFLGEEGMGYFNSAYTVYGVFFLLCTAGVPKAIMLHLLDKDMTDRDRGRIIRITMTAFAVLGTAMTLIFVMLSGAMSHIIGSSGARYTMIAIAPSILFISIGGVLRGLLTARMKLLSVAASQMIEGVGKLVLGLLFAYHGIRIGMTTELLSAYTILGVTLGSVLGFLYLYVASGAGRVLRERADDRIGFVRSISLLKKILSISLPITFSALVMSMTGIIDLVLVMQRLADIGYTELEATALYGNYTTLALPMYNLVISVITPISVAFLPVFVCSRSREDRRNEGEALRSALELTALLCAPMVVGVLTYPREILNLIFGGIGVFEGTLLLELLIPGAIFMSLLLIANSMLEARGDVRAPLISMLVACAVKFVLTYVLTGNAEYGIAGAPIGTVSSYAVALFISARRLSKKHSVKLPIIVTHFMPYLNAILSVLLSRRIFEIMREWRGDGVALLISIAFTAVVYALLCLFCGVISKNKIKKMANYTKMTA